MGRSISQLRAALFAGEPLTAAEVKEFVRYETLALRLEDGLRQTLPPDEQNRAETGDECEAFIAEVLSDLDTQDDVVVLRQRIHELVIIVRLQADRLAEHAGRTRGTRRQQSAAGKESAAARRNKARAFLEQMAKVRARPPARTSDVATATRHLQDADPDWSASSVSQRKAKVDTVTRHMREARKLIGI